MATGIHLPPEPAKKLYEDAEECGDVSHNITDHMNPQQQQQPERRG
jgi:hypothetical protein